MKILCATDLLSKSDSAIDRAGMLVDQLEADLLLLHVVSGS
jgi:universal stress protein E